MGHHLKVENENEQHIYQINQNVLAKFEASPFRLNKNGEHSFVISITCLKVAVWYSGVLRAPYLSNEFSKLVSIVATLGSFASNSTPPQNQTSAHKFSIYQFSARPPYKPNPTAPSNAPESEATESRASRETAEALMSRSESPEAPAITASGRPAMRRDGGRRRGGTRRAWAWA